MPIGLETVRRWSDMASVHHSFRGYSEEDNSFLYVEDAQNYILELLVTLDCTSFRNLLPILSFIITRRMSNNALRESSSARMVPCREIYP